MNVSAHPNENIYQVAERAKKNTLPGGRAKVKFLGIEIEITKQTTNRQAFLLWWDAYNEKRKRLGL